MKTPVVTKPRDYLIADSIDIQLEAERVARVRKRVIKHNVLDSNEFSGAVPSLNANLSGILDPYQYLIIPAAIPGVTHLLRQQSMKASAVPRCSMYGLFTYT